MGNLNLSAVEKIRKHILDKYDYVFIARIENFSWLSHGRGYVAINSERSVGSFLISKEKVYLVANRIEMERLLNEEVHGVDEILLFNWYENAEGAVKNNFSGNFCSDTGTLGDNVLEELKQLRMVLSDEEVNMYIKDGKELMEVFEDAIIELKPDMDEFQACGYISNQLISAGFLPVVLLVFSESSRKTYRHNIVRRVPLGDTFFVSTCAFKEGRPIVSMTRTVSFKKDDELLRQHYVNCKIDAQMIANTKTGITMREMFERIKEIYRENGYGEEFFKHHQGGLIGYKTREEVVNPSSKTVISKNMAFCYNPTITGTKSEDTFVLLDKPVIVSYTEDSIFEPLEFEIEGLKIKRPNIKILK